MAEWFNNPVFALGFVGALVTIGIWVGRVNSNRAQFKAFMQEIGDELKEIRASIQGIFIRLGGPVTGDSPLRLTDMGEAISESLAIKELVSRIAAEIEDQAEGKQDFEIQEISFDYINKRFQPDEELDRKIRACAYENAIPRDQVLIVFSVELRDRLLELTKA